MLKYIYVTNRCVNGVRKGLAYLALTGLFSFADLSLSSSMMLFVPQPYPVTGWDLQLII